MFNIKRRIFLKMVCLTLLMSGMFFVRNSVTAMVPGCNSIGCPIWEHCVRNVCVCDCADEYGNCIDPAVCNPT